MPFRPEVPRRRRRENDRLWATGRWPAVRREIVPGRSSADFGPDAFARFVEQVCPLPRVESAPSGAVDVAAVLLSLIVAVPIALGCLWLVSDLPAEYDLPGLLLTVLLTVGAVLAVRRSARQSTLAGFYLPLVLAIGLATGYVFLVAGAATPDEPFLGAVAILGSVLAGTFVSSVCYRTALYPVQVHRSISDDGERVAAGHALALIRFLADPDALRTRDNRTAVSRTLEIVAGSVGNSLAGHPSGRLPPHPVTRDRLGAAAAAIRELRVGAEVPGHGSRAAISDALVVVVARIFAGDLAGLPQAERAGEDPAGPRWGTDLTVGFAAAALLLLSALGPLVPEAWRPVALLAGAVVTPVVIAVTRRIGASGVASEARSLTGPPG